MSPHGRPKGEFPPEGTARSAKDAPVKTAALEVRGLSKRFGGLRVTREVSFQLRPGDRLALIGPNGAGKTTLVHQISGVLQPDAGTVHLHGQDLTRLPQAGRVRRGLARTFQITTLAPHLPVQRQVELALFEREGLSGRAWRRVDDHPAIQAEALALLQRFGLQDQAATATQDLAYGEQRLVEMALALALRPRVLLLDEPMAGVPRADGARLEQALDTLPADLAVLIIEHDMDLVFRIATRILVLAEGAVLAEGSPQEIRQDARVRAAYLGH